MGSSVSAVMAFESHHCCQDIHQSWVATCQRPIEAPASAATAGARKTANARKATVSETRSPRSPARAKRRSPTAANTARS